MSLIKKSIVIIGPICSGKSTLAKHLSEELSIPITSFSEYLLDYSKKNNLKENSRKDLQDLGQSMIENDPVLFLHKVITFSLHKESDIIFEGVRHEIILKEIEKISFQTLSIYIDASYEQRLKRYSIREGIIGKVKSEHEFEIANIHPVEQEIPLLKKHCNFILNSSDIPANDFLQLKSFLE